MNWNIDIIGAGMQANSGKMILNTKVLDYETKEPLTGANITITDANGKAIPINGEPVVGRKADYDGAFTMPIIVPNAYITVSYVGYQSITEPATRYGNKNILLKSKSFSLNKKEIKVTAKRLKTTPTKNPKPPVPPKKFPWLIVIIATASVAIAGVVIYHFTKKNKK